MIILPGSLWGKFPTCLVVIGKLKTCRTYSAALWQTTCPCFCSWLDRDVNKRTIFNLFKYLLALSLLAYVIYANWSPDGGHGLGYVWERHVNEGQPIHTPFLLLAGVLYLANLLIAFVRWYVLVRAQNVPFTIAGALRLGLIGFFGAGACVLATGAVTEAWQAVALLCLAFLINDLAIPVI